MSKTFMNHGFPPLSSLRLIVPPLQLMSAALLEIVRHGAVVYYGVLEEFITTVLDAAPGLLTDTERVQLLIGLRAKVVLELCRNDTLASLQDFQHHVSQMNTYITSCDKETPDSKVKASVTNFLKLVHTLVEDQCRKDIFFKYIFPIVFGPKFDSALQALMKKCLLNLQELLPVPNLEQTSLGLSLSSSILKECVDFMNQPQPLKTLLQHHKHHGHKVNQDFSISGDDYILSSLSFRLTNVDHDQGFPLIKSEPICDPEDWQMKNFLDSESKKDKEDIKVLYSELEKNVEEHGQQCVDDVTEDQGASVEVILPSFDETESSDEDHMDQKWFHRLKTVHKTSAKTSECYRLGEDVSSLGKQKEHKITRCAYLTAPMTHLDSTSQSSPFEEISSHHTPRTCGNNKALRGETELSTLLSVKTNDPLNLNLQNVELSNDDCCLFCHVCDRVFACKKNFKKHLPVCAGRSKCKEEVESHWPLSPAHHSELSSSETSNEVPQESLSSNFSQDQACKRGSRVKQCSICKEIFSRSTDFMKHMKCHAELSPFLGSHCSNDFESSEDFEKHQDGKCKASNQHLEDYSMSSENKGDCKSTAVSIEIRETTTPTEVAQNSKTRKPLLTCPECGMCFIYCKSFEKHQIKCLEAASQKKNKSDCLIFSDPASAGNTNERHTEKSSETTEETPSGVVFKSDENCETQEEVTCRASNQYEEKYSLSNERGRNLEITLVSSEMRQTSTTADIPADSRARTPPVTCQQCGQHFTYFKSFKNHKRKCLGAASQSKTNNSYVSIGECGFFSAGSSNKSQAGENSEMVETNPSSSDFKSLKDSEMHKKDTCRASNQHLEDYSQRCGNSRNQDKTLVSSETSQTSSTEDAPADSKASATPLTCQKCGLRFTYCKSFEKHRSKCSGAASQKRTYKNYLIISGCDFFLAGNTNDSHDEKSPETTGDDAGVSQYKARTCKCSMCEEIFPDMELLKRHYSESHDVSGPFPCTLCKRAFSRLYELVRHQQNKQLFLCPTCKKGFSSQAEIKRHEKIHTASATPCVCETCGKSFKFQFNLIRHRRRHKERPPSVCSYCGKQFSSKDGLKAHMVRHTDGFPCPVCGKKFYQKAYLTYHLNRHTGQEKYLCDICGKGWPTRSLLKVHMVKHTEGQPFMCNDCGLTYKRNSGLMAHYRDKHLGLRPFVCEVCSKAYRIKSQLKEHMAVHTGERRFSCPLCGKKFTKKFLLKKHREKPCL